MSAKRMNGKLRVDQIKSRVIIWTRVGDTMDQNGSWLLLSECMWFNVPMDTYGVIDESFQAVDCTGTDNQTTKRKYNLPQKTNTKT